MPQNLRSGLSLSTIFILASYGKVLCHSYVPYFVFVRWIPGLTSVFSGFLGLIFCKYLKGYRLHGFVYGLFGGWIMTLCPVGWSRK